MSYNNSIITDLEQCPLLGFQFVVPTEKINLLIINVLFKSQRWVNNIALLIFGLKLVNTE